jgi:hypothetical protein
MNFRQVEENKSELRDIVYCNEHPLLITFIELNYEPEGNDGRIVLRDGFGAVSQIPCNKLQIRLQLSPVKIQNRTLLI